MAEVKPVTDADFENDVLKSPIPVLVDFWAPWCGPCKMMGPVVDSLAARFAGKLKVCKLNTDENPATPGAYNVHGIPTLILFKAGRETERLVGYMPESALADKLQPLLT
ncbi:thioredoxin [candidate division WOR-3 bacterium]|nr:thioredoxin [candidate division WOR-3 bacterium]